MSKIDEKTNRNYTHMVVKKQRGSQGEWFSYPAAMTGSEVECMEYAEQFAREQAGVPGTRITVQTRAKKVVKSISV